MVQLHKAILTKRRNVILNGGSSDTGYQSILEKLITMKMQGEISLSDEQYTSLFIMNMTFNQTIRNAFSWMIKCLSENKICQDKILNEIMQMKINDLYSNGILPLDKFEYLDKFVCETIRMYPSEMVTMVVTNSFEFDGHVFPVETLVDINLKALHRHPLFWDSPEKFMPERFSTQSRRDAYTYLPFSAGPRICPGNRGNDQNISNNFCQDSNLMFPLEKMAAKKFNQSKLQHVLQNQIKPHRKNILSK